MGKGIMGSIHVYHLMTLTLLLLRSQLISSEVFSASADLTSTFRLEQQVVNVLGELVAQTEAKLGIIRQWVWRKEKTRITQPLLIWTALRYLKDYESVVEEKATNEEEFIERVAGNPIHAYRLMKRLYFDWQTVEKEIKTDEWRSMCPIRFKSTILFQLTNCNY